MTKRHATNPGVVRERRAKAAIEKRAEKLEKRRQPKPPPRPWPTDVDPETDR